MKFWERIKQKTINLLLRRSFNVTVLEDIISSDKQGRIILGKNIITENELRQLIAECKALEGFRIWSIMNETLKKEAFDRGWNNSTKMEDLNAGKTIFYTLDLQNSIIATIRSKDMTGK